MSTTAAQNRSAITTYNFKVTIPDIDTIGYFAECRGLELSFEIYQYREGGNNDFVHQLPGRIMYPNLILSRGLTNEDALLKWFWTTATKAEKKELTLTLASGDITRTWTFVDAFPVKWNGPSCSQGQHGVATESLEIAHTGLKMV
jgi:phage tail-like protein